MTRGATFNPTPTDPLDGSTSTTDGGVVSVVVPVVKLKLPGLVSAFPTVSVICEPNETVYTVVAFNGLAGWNVTPLSSGENVNVPATTVPPLATVIPFTAVIGSSGSLNCSTTPTFSAILVSPLSGLLPVNAGPVVFGANSVVKNCSVKPKALPQVSWMDDWKLKNTRYGRPTLRS